MEKQPNRLWRKIGLEKNFLQGTSYSDQSKFSLPSQEQLSPFRTVFQQSRHKIDQPTQHNKLNALNSLNRQQQQSHMQRFISNKELHANEEIQSPISKLEFSDFQHNCTQWQKHVNNHQEKRLNVNRNVDNLLALHEYEEQKRFNNIETSSQVIESDFDISMKKSLYMNSVVSVESHIVETPHLSQYFHANKSKPLHKLHSSGENNMKSNEMSAKYSYHLKEVVDKKMKRKHFKKDSEIQVVQCEEIFTISGEEFNRYERIQQLMYMVQKRELPLVYQKVSQLRKIHTQTKNHVNYQLKQMRQQISSLFMRMISEKVQQLNDQIGYLYSQNQGLMLKIQQKQAFIKKTSQEVQMMSQTLLTLQKVKSSQQNEKDLVIEKQQNQINKFYQKMEDLQQLQNNNEYYNKKIHQLEEEITRVNQGEVQMKQKHLQLSNKLSQRQQTLLSQQQKILQLQQQLNQLYTKLDEIQFKLNGEYQQQLQKQQQQFTQKLKQQHANFHAQMQHIKTKLIQATSKQYQTVMEQMLKKINHLQVENIIKKFSIEKNQYMRKVFEKAKQLHTKQLRIESSFINSSAKKFVVDDSIRLGEYTESDYQNSPSKNLKRTGFFGQATSHVNLNNFNSNPIVNDIAKRYSTERSQINQELALYKNMYETLPYKEKKKTSRSPQDYSQKSYSSLFREQQTYKGRMISLHPQTKNRQRSNSSGWQSKRQNSEMLYNNDQYNQKKQLKVCQTKRQYLTSNDGHDISFTNSQNNGFDEPVEQMNAYKYSFSELNQINLQNISSPAHSLPYETMYEQNKYFRSSKNQLPSKNTSPSPNKKGYQVLINQKNQVNDIVERVRQKINQKFQHKEQFNSKDSFFKSTQFKNTPNKSLKIPSPLHKQQVSPNNLLNKQMNFEKLSKNYSFAHPTKVTPSLISPLQTSRSKSNKRLKSPSLDSKMISSISPRASLNNFVKLNKPTGQMLTTSFSRPLNTYDRVSPSKRQSIMKNSHLKSSLYQGSRVQTPRDSYNLSKY